jgi:hypothetical protein
MIDPRETRPILCSFLNASLNRLTTHLGPPTKQWTMRA